MPATPASFPLPVDRGWKIPSPSSEGGRGEWTYFLAQHLPPADLALSHIPRKPITRMKRQRDSLEGSKRQDSLGHRVTKTSLVLCWHGHPLPPPDSRAHAKPMPAFPVLFSSFGCDGVSAGDLLFAPMGNKQQAGTESVLWVVQACIDTAVAAMIG